MKKGLGRLTRIQVTTLLSGGYTTTYNKLGTLKYTPGAPALLVVTGGSQQKKAVLRNKVRRRIRSVFEQSKPQNTMVLFVAKNAYTMTFEEIKTYAKDLVAKSTKNS